MLEGGNLDYEVSGRVEAISAGGLGLMQSVVEAVGLAEAIDGRLHLLRRHLPYHESDHVLPLVYNILAGGRCLEDLELRRSDEGLLLPGSEPSIRPANEPSHLSQPAERCDSLP